MVEGDFCCRCRCVLVMRHGEMIFKCPCKESNCVGRVLQTVCLLFFIYNIYISLWSLAFIEPQTTVKELWCTAAFIPCTLLRTLLAFCCFELAVVLVTGWCSVLAVMVLAVDFRFRCRAWPPFRSFPSRLSEPRVFFLQVRWQAKVLLHFHVSSIT